MNAVSATGLGNTEVLGHDKRERHENAMRAIAAVGLDRWDQK